MSFKSLLPTCLHEEPEQENEIGTMGLYLHTVLHNRMWPLMWFAETASEKAGLAKAKIGALQTVIPVRENKKISHKYKPGISELDYWKSRSMGSEKQRTFVRIITFLSILWKQELFCPDNSGLFSRTH